MLTDIRGQEVKKGDIVAYPVRQGSNMWLRFGNVVGLLTTEADGRGTVVGVRVAVLKQDGVVRAARILRNLRNIVVVEKA